MTAPESHRDAALASAHTDSVSRIQKDLQTFRHAKRPFRIYHGSTSSTRPMNFSRAGIIDVSDMTRIFPIDVAARTVKCEPNVPMDALVAHTLAHGLIPKIVMELKGITVGGGFSGASGESSMHRFGLFQNIISEIEIVLGDGSLESASREHKADLLEHAGGSLGTFGIVTLLTVELMEAKKFVDLQVSRIESTDNIVAAMEGAIAKDAEYVDGIFYGPGRIAMMIGTMVDTPAKTPLKKMEAHWFSSHVESKLMDSPLTLSLKLEDYLFRYDHGAFWGGELAFKHYHLPKNFITKRLADPFLDSRTCYQALHKTGLASMYCVQDFGVPANQVAAFITYVRSILPECQLFLCPGKSPDEMQFSSRLAPRIQQARSERLFGVGVYGKGPKDPDAFRELNRKLEVKASELLALKLLYARTYYTHDEFWDSYSKPAYDEMRLKYKAVEPAGEKGESWAMPDVYDKLAADMSHRPKMRPIRGALSTVKDKVLGREDYLLRKK